MPPLINAQEISKTFGVTQLFKNISFTVSEADRIGLIGPNGAGKSTLLQILEGRLKPDSGHIAVRKRTRVSYVGQQPAFAAGQTVRSVVELAMRQSAVPEADRQSTMAETLGRAGFTALEADAASLSGGWRKRLAIVEGLVRLPDVLFLDEPTNHLDLAGIRWLEGVLQAGTFAAVVVSHDRYLLEHVAGELVELNRTYEEGLLRVKGNYSVFLQARDDYARAQGKLQETLSNRVRNEIEWLRRGPKARATKAKARIETAMEMIRELADVNARNRVSTAGIDFTATDRSTKQLIELDKVEYAIDGRTLFSGVGLMIQPGMRVGLVGPNGSGKTTLLRLIRGDIQPGAWTRSTGRSAAYRLLRSESGFGSRHHLEAHPCTGFRLGCLSGPSHPCRFLGSSFPVFQRRSQSACGKALGWRTRPSADRSTHAPARRRDAAG